MVSLREAEEVEVEVRQHRQAWAAGEVEEEVVEA